MANKMTRRISLKDLTSMAQKGEKIVSVATYSTTMARLFDPYCDILLVGDSVGMVVYGMSSTLGVTTQMMIDHGKAVIRGSKRACVAIDLPFGSYQESPSQAFRTASEILAQTGAQFIKIEGGEEMVPTVQFLTQRGIPVWAHIGLKPQSINIHGNFGVVGKEDEEAQQIFRDAQALEKAGAVALLLENIPRTLAQKITNEANILTVGIGASDVCHGQILVGADMLGIFDAFKPKFVRRFSELAPQIRNATESYRDAIKQGDFPSDNEMTS